MDAYFVHLPYKKMFQLVYIYQMKKIFEYSKNLHYLLILGYSDSAFWELVIKLQWICICF